MNDEGLLYKPIKKLKQGFKILIIDLRQAVLVAIKLLVPAIILFFMAKGTVAKGASLIFDFFLYYFFLSKSLTKVEFNYKTIRRVLFDKFNKDSLSIKLDDYGHANALLLDNSVYVVAARKSGKAISTMGSSNYSREEEISLNFLVDNIFSYKEISILEENPNHTKEEVRDDEISKERKKITEYLISQDYLIFYVQKEKSLIKVVDFINDKNDYDLVDKEKLFSLYDYLIDEYDENNECFETHNLYMLNNLGDKLEEFYIYDLKQLLEEVDGDYVLVNEYKPYGIEEAKQIVNAGITEVKDYSNNSIRNDSEGRETDKKHSSLEIINDDLCNGIERIYQYSSYFLINKEIDKNVENKLIRDIKKLGLHYSQVNILAKYIYKKRFIFDPILTFDIQSNIIKFAFENEKCLLSDMYGKFLSFANNGHIIFNPYIIAKSRTSFSMSMLGLQWSGKSTLLKILIHLQLINNNKVIILDIEDEYSIFTKRKGGVVLDINNIFLNIMEIFIDDYILKDNDDEKGENVNRSEDDLFFKNMQTNVERIITFFSYLIEEEDVLTQLKTELNKYYTELYIKHDNDKYFSKKYVLLDFYNYIYKKNRSVKEFDYKVDELANVRRSKLELELEALITSNASMFEKQTSIDLSEKLICVNMQELFEHSKKSKLNQAFCNQIYNLVLWESMKRNRNENEEKGIGRHNFMDNYEEASFLTIVNDEEHQTLVNENTELVKIIESFTRRGPKYLTGIWGATHSPDEYLVLDGSEISNLKKTLFQLRTYKILFKQPTSSEKAFEFLLVDEGDDEANFTMDHVRKTFKYDVGDFLLTFGNEVYEGYHLVDDVYKDDVYRVKKDS